MIKLFTSVDHLLYKDKKGEWRWRIKAKNGKIICSSSEGYVRKIDAKKNIKLIYKVLKETFEKKN